MGSGDFRVVGQIKNIEVIASGRGVRSAARLRALFGAGRWRKMKGEADIEEVDGTMRFAELHWYEAHGVGRHGWKIKRYLD
ncbi:MAG: hypothetical protein M3552_12920 [Planctomycetota bacterium]|nr:hypothetical protein [Planctomycetaceae bacterium]MDQ3331535.1 hypothetical protein [Planctomycetota bacterium]